MSLKSEMNLLLAQADLLVLNNVTALSPEEPIVIAVAKAASVALSHRDVETRVFCDCPGDYATAQLLLKNRIASDYQGRWLEDQHTLELPNGSAVVVIEGRT